MEQKQINNILNDIKLLILNSKEYIEYSKNEEKLENNLKIKSVINEIKNMQKNIINKEYKKQDKEIEEFQVQNLFRELNSCSDYNEYIKSARNLNKYITDIKDNFENYFNELLK